MVELQLHAERDRERSLGHARIVISGLASVPSAVEFIIRREGYSEANLGRSGWQVREERLRPVAVLSEAKATVLIVAPSLTHHLEAGPYHFVLPALNGDGVVFWPDDIDVFDGDIQARETAPEPEPEPDDSTVTLRAVRRGPPPRSEDPTVQEGEETKRDDTVRVDHQVVVDPPVPEPKPPSSWLRYLLIALGIVVLVAASGSALWFWRDEIFGKPMPLVEPKPPEPPPSPSSPAPAPAPAWPDGTDALSPSQVIEQAANPADIHAVAVRRQGAGNHEDALQLFEVAAERNYGPAHTALGRMYDPNGFVAGRPFASPDLRNAACHYKEAVVRGDASAEAPREALRLLLEREVQGGSGSAATALKECWP